MSRALALVLPLALVAASLASCGGNAFEDDEHGGGAGTSSSGGSTGGGFGGGKAGGSSGGGKGGTSSGGGSGGGTLPSLCALPAEAGPCNAYIPSFFYNAETGACEPFVYGGCQGNENRFDSLDDCLEQCGGALPDVNQCTTPLDCVLVSRDCCDPCDGTLADYIAIRADYQDLFYSARECGLVACEPCPAPDPTTANRPYLTATCRNGRCEPIDLRDEGVTDCEVADDCRLRAGVGCCEDCGEDPSSLVAVSTSSSLGDLVCGNDAPPCLACEPVYPTEFKADCGENRCIVTYVRP